MNNTRTHFAGQPGVANPSWGDQSSDRLVYDGAAPCARMITKRFLAGGIDTTGGGGGSPTYAYNDPTALVGFTTSFDASSNKLFERALHAEPRSSLYEPFSDGVPLGGYDSLNRLRQYQRGVQFNFCTGGRAAIGARRALEQFHLCQLSFGGEGGDFVAWG